MIQCQSSDYLFEKSLIDLPQNGCVITRSWVICMLDFFRVVTRIRYQKELVDVLCLDIKKAFDKVPHNLIINRLQSTEFTNLLSEWIKSFLTSRYWMVKINSTTSIPQITNGGFVQSSILRPAANALSHGIIIPGSAIDMTLPEARILVKS